MKMIKTYSELIKLKTFDERFDYLKLNGKVGEETFGYRRFLNQFLYQHNSTWKSIRQKVIIRDNGNDLAFADRMICDRIIVHHINPIMEEDLINNSSMVFDLDNLICTSFRTHNAIHYGDKSLLIGDFVPRSKHDTAPWL